MTPTFRYALIYGGLASTVLAAFIAVTAFLNHKVQWVATLTFGYSVMLVAMSFIFVGVKRYRDVERGGVIRLPNHGFSISRGDMRDFLSIQRVNLVNDFVAKALAIPRLRESERQQICGGEPMEEQVIAVLGPHNGLGMSALAPDGMGAWTAMPTEGGHSDLAATNALEDQVLGVLMRKYGHVSRERVISIPGLVDIWRALAEIDGDDIDVPGPEEIIARAMAEDTRAHQVIDLSMGWFAAMAADVALILGARGGVYLAGDLLDMIGDLFDVEAFVKRYTDKGRLSGYVAEIPVFRATAQDMEVIGLATLFD